MNNIYKSYIVALALSVACVSWFSCNKDANVSSNTGNVERLSNNSGLPDSFTVKTSEGELTFERLSGSDIQRVVSGAPQLTPKAIIPVPQPEPDPRYYIQSNADLGGVNYLAADGNWNGANITTRDFDDNRYRGREWSVAELVSGHGTVFTNRNFGMFAIPRNMEVFLNGTTDDNASLWTSDRSRPQTWAVFALRVPNAFENNMVIVNLYTKRVLTVFEKLDDYSYAVRVGVTLEEFKENYEKDADLLRRSTWRYIKIRR